MLFRFQLTDRTLSSMLRGRFQRQDLCVTAPLIDGSNPTYVDHIEFPTVMPLVAHILSAGTPKQVSIPVAGGGPLNLSVPTLVLSREVNVYTTTLSDLMTANGGPPATTLNPLVLQFSLSVDHTPIVVNNKPTFMDELTIAYYGLDPVTSEALKSLGLSVPQVDAQLRALLPAVSTSLSAASSFTSLAGNAFNPVSIWSGIAASSDFSLAEIRMEFSTTGASGVANSSVWANFYNNNAVDNIVGDQDWAYFIEQDLLTGMVGSLVTPAVQTSASFRLETGPTFVWDGTRPGVVASFSGDAINACQCAWGQIDVGEDITLDVDFSENDGWLQIDVHLDHSSNQLDILCCELTATLLWPFIGLSMTESSVWGRLEYAVGILAPPAVFVVAIVEASQETPSVPTVKGFTVDSNDPSHLSSQVSVTASLESADDVFELRVVTGTATGLVLGGSHTDNALAPAVIEAAITPFAWYGPEVNCSGNSGTWMARATIAVTRASGDLDFSLCEVTVFPSSWNAELTTAFEYNPYSVEISISTPKYIAGSASVFIQTTGGLRYVSFAAMPQLTQQQIRDTTILEESWRLEHCFTLVTPWSRYFSRFNPKWAIDPAIGDAREKERQQLWITAIAGFHPGDHIVVTAPTGETIETAFANSAGSIRSNTMVNARSIYMERRPAGSETQPDSTAPRLTQKQVLLVVGSSISIGEPVLAMQAVPARYGSNILVATCSGLRVFKINAQGAWSLTDSWLQMRLAGALSSGGRLLAWSASGDLVDLSAMALRVPPPTTVIGNRLAAIDTREVTHAAIVDKRLLVIDAARLRSIDSAAIPVVNEEIASLRSVGRSSFLVKTASGTYRLYSQWSESLFLSSIYEHRPWFDGSLNIGNWTVTLSDDQCNVRLLAMEAQQTL